MLTNDQVSALRVAFEKIADPVNEYLIQDIARRVSEAGQLTSTAAYQIWRAKNLGMSRKEIEKAVAAILKKSAAEVRELFKQAAEVGYRFDLDQLPTANAIPFEDNISVQQIVETAVKLADEQFQNITQTLGFQTPDGTVHPLLDAYQKTTDYAFQQVISGAADYNTAIRQACRKLADGGVKTIDYASGVRTSLEAAIRRNMMGGLGLMVEQISQKNHDDLGADGWELSAHANSAPDHEPFQGKQYTDEAYTKLNDMLQRRIGTLNCGHNAFPIILGVNEPQHTKAELEKFRVDNENGITFEGRHYTGYEATQMQRKLERSIRAQKRRVLAAEASGDKEGLTIAKTRLQVLRQNYRRFSKTAGLRTEDERLFVSGFGRKQAAKPAPKTKAPVVEKKVTAGAHATPAAPPPVNPPAVPTEKQKTPRPSGVDVLDEYIKNATPGVGSITFEEGYKPGKHQSEIKTAQWLHETFGGDIVLLNESTVDGKKVPDYQWRGKLWDLKNTTTAKSADSAVRGGLKQIAENPGGIILDYEDNEILIENVEEIVEDRVLRGKNPTVDIMIVSRGEAVKILRYKKRTSPPPK